MGVKGNHPEISYGGELIRELVASGQYLIVNNTDVAIGGPFTRLDPADENKKSCLDLCIVSQNLIPYVREMLVDRDRNFTPKRAITKGHRLTVRYTDHLSYKVSLQGLPTSKREVANQTKWNLMKPGGWKKF